MEDFTVAKRIFDNAVTMHDNYFNMIWNTKPTTSVLDPLYERPGASIFMDYARRLTLRNIPLGLFIDLEHKMDDLNCRTDDWPNSVALWDMINLYRFVYKADGFFVQQNAAANVFYRWLQSHNNEETITQTLYVVFMMFSMYFELDTIDRLCVNFALNEKVRRGQHFYVNEVLNAGRYINEVEDHARDFFIDASSWKFRTRAGKTKQDEIRQHFVTSRSFFKL